MPFRPIVAALLPLGYLFIALLVAGLLAVPLHLYIFTGVSLRAVVSRCTLALILLSLPWLVVRLNLTGHGASASLDHESTRVMTGFPHPDPLPKGEGDKVAAVYTVRRADFGLAIGASRCWQGLAGGWLLGLVVMLLLVLLEAWLGLRAAIWPSGQFVERLLAVSARPLLVGLLVGCVEELLFRGVLLGAYLKYRGAFYAVAVSAFYYAALHFYHSSLKLPEEGLYWASGLLIVGDGFLHLLSWDHLDSFVALYCAGLLLGCLRLLAKPGLALCIGMHAGWVYCLRTALALTDMTADSPWRFLVGNYDHIIGWLAAGWLALLSAPLLLILHKRSRL